MGIGHLSLPKTPYALWRLSLSVSADNVCHAPEPHGPPCGDSVQPSHARPTRSGDLGPPPPTRRPPADRASTASAQSSRPIPVGAALTSLEPLAGGRADRATRHRRRLASPPLRLALAPAFRATPARSPSDRSGHPRPDSNDASRESDLGPPAHSRRTPEVGHRRDD